MYIKSYKKHFNDTYNSTIRTYDSNSNNIVTIT